MVAGVLLAAINLKLTWVARVVTRGATLHELDPGNFWLGRPWLLLPLIKALLFAVSMIFSSQLFNAAQCAA